MYNIWLIVFVFSDKTVLNKETRKLSPKKLPGENYPAEKLPHVKLIPRILLPRKLLPRNITPQNTAQGKTVPLWEINLKENISQQKTVLTEDCLPRDYTHWKLYLRKLSLPPHSAKKKMSPEKMFPKGALVGTSPVKN